MYPTSLYHPTIIIYSNVPFRRRFISALRRRHHRRNLLKKPFPTTSPATIYSPSSSSSPPDQQTLQLQISLQPPSSLDALVNSSKLHLERFVLSSQDAFEDLKTLVKVDSYNPNGVVVSCKRSTVEFLGSVLIASFVAFYALRGVLKFGKVLFSLTRNDDVGGGEVVYRRDRSLGGKLVPVGRKGEMTPLDYARRRKNENVDSSMDSFWDWGDEINKVWGRSSRKEGSLPKWWPPPGLGSGIGVMVDDDDKEEYQRMANRFIRAIMDNRLRGKDISEDDIIQLRSLCKTYRVRVSIDTENARDSFYRTAINFVLDYCENPANESASLQIGGEDVQQFIAGLADNIGLENSRAARMVSAAVAARTRSRFLQAWALEMQGKHPEAVAELSKICLIHQIFPPEEYSPEMEMVARGLENHLKLDQRESLMHTLTRVCGEETPRSVIEALGLAQ